MSQIVINNTNLTKPRRLCLFVGNIASANNPINYIEDKKRIKNKAPNYWLIGHNSILSISIPISILDFRFVYYSDVFLVIGHIHQRTFI